MQNFTSPKWLMVIALMCPLAAYAQGSGGSGGGTGGASAGGAASGPSAGTGSATGSPNAGAAGRARRVSVACRAVRPMIRAARTMRQRNDAGHQFGRHGKFVWRNHDRRGWQSGRRPCRWCDRTRAFRYGRCRDRCREQKGQRQDQEHLQGLLGGPARSCAQGNGSASRNSRRSTNCRCCTDAAKFTFVHFAGTNIRRVRCVEGWLRGIRWCRTCWLCWSLRTTR